MSHDRRAAWPRPNDAALENAIAIAAIASPAHTDTRMPQPVLNPAATNQPNVTSTATIKAKADTRQIL